MSLLRLISPSVVDVTALSCRTLQTKGLRSFHVAARNENLQNPDEKVQNKDIKTGENVANCENKDIKINPLFLNRNPRALEKMGLAPKIKGWKFQSPRKDFYHKLVFDKSQMSASVVHCSGKTVIDASTREPTLAKHLYSGKDVSASYNLGRLISKRMLEAGITEVFYDRQLARTTDTDRDSLNSEKMQAFFKALEENAIQLWEPDVVQHESVPGVDYSGYNRVDERPRYQTDYQRLTKKK